MGLGLYTAADIAGGDATGRLGQLKHKLETRFRTAELAPYARFDHVRGAGQLYAFLHPADEPVEFWITEDRLYCAAQTSAAGPGYHAYVVETLDWLAQELSIAWVWDNENEELGDETGYVRHRDFDRLQFAMADWSREVARLVIDRARAGSQNFRLSLSVELSNAIEELRFTSAFALSPMGPWDKTFFENVASADDMVLPSVAKTFFPWWDRGFTPTTWFNIARVLLWTEFPWRSPLETDERQIGHFAVDCIARAEEQGYPNARPDLNYAELQTLLSAGNAFIAPAPNGIGYKRGAMRRSFPDGWTIAVPGYFLEIVEDDGNTVITFDDVVIFGTSISFERPADRALGDALAADKIGNDFIVETSGDGFVGRANIRYVADASPPNWSLNGGVEAEKGVFIATMRFVREAARDRCIEYFRSIRPPKVSVTSNDG
jgi:hypothetical protein